MHTEWTLHAGVLKHVFSCLGTPHVDLFATRLNHQLPTYVSPVPDSLALGGRLFEHDLGGHARLRIPPFSAAVSGDTQDQHRVVSGVIDCSTLAGPAVVQSSVVTSGGNPHLSSTQERPTVSTSVSVVPCQSGHAPSARIRSMQRCMQEKGFSEQVAK